MWAARYSAIIADVMVWRINCFNFVHTVPANRARRSSSQPGGRRKQNAGRISSDDVTASLTSLFSMWCFYIHLPYFSFIEDILSSSSLMSHHIKLIFFIAFHIITVHVYIFQGDVIVFISIFLITIVIVIFRHKYVPPTNRIWRANEIPDYKNSTQTIRWR